jgi:hypothetical protein
VPFSAVVVIPRPQQSLMAMHAINHSAGNYLAPVYIAHLKLLLL